VPIRDRVVPIRDRVVPIRDRVVPIRDRVEPIRDRVEPIRDRVVPIRDRVVPIWDRVEPIRDRVVPIRDRVVPMPGSPDPASCNESVMSAAPEVRNARRMRLVLGITVVAALTLSGCKKAAPPPDQLRVAAAADLSRSFQEIGDAFQKSTGTPVTFSFAATGLLAKQIAEGAPFDVFAAANIAFVDDAVKSGACFGDTRAKYATGHIAMWSRDGASFAPQALADLAKPEVVHVAIANPDHAPYGKAAKQALVKAGVWDAIEKKIVYGENVQQTLQFAQSGNAEVAIVAQSLASVSGGHSVPVDPALHAPIEQALVVCKGAPEAAGKMEPVARRFAAFVTSDEGRAILKRYGFGAADEASASAIK
jgi:molybdate transport system substrate-binding protein